MAYVKKYRCNIVSVKKVEFPDKMLPMKQVEFMRIGIITDTGQYREFTMSLKDAEKTGIATLEVDSDGTFRQDEAVTVCLTPEYYGMTEKWKFDRIET